MRCLCLSVSLLPALLFGANATPTVASIPLPPDVNQSWLHPTHKDGPRLIALTFDYGPAPGTGDKIMDALKVAKWSATFCVLGNNARQHPEMVKRMLAEGHEVAAHS